jgi:hypothetical protein
MGRLDLRLFGPCGRAVKVSHIAWLRMIAAGQVYPNSLFRKRSEFKADPQR